MSSMPEFTPWLLSSKKNKLFNKNNSDDQENTAGAGQFTKWIPAKLKDVDLERIDLLKIDTEGSEYLILEGAGKVLKKDRPIVICETLFNLIEEKLESIFIELDYEFYNHSENGLVKVNSIQRKEDNGVRNCFFVPKEKVSLIKEFRFSN